jgi:hypothetical protein
VREQCVWYIAWKPVKEKEEEEDEDEEEEEEEKNYLFKINSKLKGHTWWVKCA